MSATFETPFSAARFQGSLGGSLKDLSGFQKGYSLPDSPGEYADRTAQRLGAEDLAKHAEDLFQALRGAFGYKRRELSLGTDAETGSATIDAPDYRVDIGLAGHPDAAARYQLSTEVAGIANAEVIRSPEFASVFDGRFDRMVFDFTQPVDIDDIIDRVEDLESDQITVAYPSDASECTVTVAGLDAKLHFMPKRLSVVAPHNTEVATLLAASERVPTMFG